MKTLFLTFFILVSFNYLDAKINSVCPESRLLQADQCAKDSFFLLNPEFEGHADNNVDTYCKQIDKATKCLTDYTNSCLINFTKQTSVIGINGIKKHYRSICSPNAPKRKTFVQKTSWIKKSDVDQISPCAVASVKNMNFIADSINSDNQIPEACCNYWLTRRCISKRLKNLTSESNREFIESLADDSLTGLIRFLCTKENSIEYCQKNRSQAMSRMKNTFKNSRNTREKFQSFLIPFLNVLSD